MSDTGDERPRSGVVMTYVYDARSIGLGRGADPAGLVCEHDEAKRVFRVTEPDGKVTEFHDRAVRFLVVAPDPQNGQAGAGVFVGECPRSCICAGRRGCRSSGQWSVVSGQW